MMMSKIFEILFHKTQKMILMKKDLNMKMTKIVPKKQKKIKEMAKPQ